MTDTAPAIPPSVEGPHCWHTGTGPTQPASACRICEARADEWTAAWDRFIAAHPEHPLARQAVRYREATR
jgi:hypothetical protein